MKPLSLVSVSLFLLLLVGCQHSSVEQLESTVAKAEQRLETLKRESSPEAVEAKLEELHRREEELVAQKLVMAQQLEEKMRLQGWLPLTRTDGTPTRYFRRESAERVGPGVVWFQSLALSQDSETQELTWLFTGMRFKPKEGTWVPADRATRVVSATGYRPMEGRLEERALVALAKLSHER